MADVVRMIGILKFGGLYLIKIVVEESILHIKLTNRPVSRES
jgi:hypothetical protein